MNSTPEKPEKRDTEGTAPTITISIEIVPITEPTRRTGSEQKQDAEEIFTLRSLTKSALIGLLLAPVILIVGFLALVIFSGILSEWIGYVLR